MHNDHTEHADAVYCGFTIYDFPLNFDDLHCSPEGECLLDWSHQHIVVTDYSKGPYYTMTYRIEQ